jgi:hypothetical protein
MRTKVLRPMSDALKGYEQQKMFKIGEEILL